MRLVLIWVQLATRCTAMRVVVLFFLPLVAPCKVAAVALPQGPVDSAVGIGTDFKLGFCTPKAG